MPAELGHLERAAEQWQLVFHRELAHAPDVVWRALTEPEQLAAWFPQHIEGDRAAGAPIRFVSREPGAPAFDGEFLTVEPPRLLELRWGDDTLRFQVEARGAGSLLTLVHTFAEQGKAARDGAGWHACLDALEASLDGTPGDGPAVAVWQRVHPQYVAALGPDAATIGPPADHPVLRD